MKVKLTVESNELTKEDLKSLLQAIRDCEQSTFPDKKISILADVPELTTDETVEVLKSIEPRYKYGAVMRFSTKKT